MLWDKLKSFYHVARLGSFSKAGEHMHISQSALSRTVMSIEYSLKKKLFVRSVRGVSLTPEGEIVFETVKKMVADMESLKESLAEDNHLPKGNLRLTTTKALASMWLPYYISPFLEKHKDFSLNIIADDHELDLGIREADVAIRPYMPHQPDYIQRYLQTFNPRLYASPTYLEKFGMPKKVDDLDHHRLLVFGGNRVSPFGNVNWLLHVGRGDKGPREPYISLNLSHGLYEIAIAGLGIVALSKEYSPLNNSGLIHILPEIQSPPIDIYYVYHESQSKSQRVTALANYLEETLSSKAKEK